MIKRRTFFAVAVGIALSSLAPSYASEAKIEQLAKQVTVRILTTSNSGSGVIIDRRNTTYTVLTNEHVTSVEPSQHYTILTVDGKTHRGSLRSLGSFEALDLALVEFESQTAYQPVALGNSEAVQAGESVYAAGFPNYHTPADRRYLESTYNWGTKAFLLTRGIVSMHASKSLLRGYSLGYTNVVRDGMSGGPVLDRAGRLVGINGRLSYSMQGNRAFVFTDGTQPPQALIKQMQPLSWAIPTSQFRSLLVNYF